MPGNEDDFRGYSEKELLVKAKYGTYKQETLCHLCMNKCEMTVTKAKEYMTSTKIKTIRQNELSPLFDHGISENDQMSLSHVLSLILYCDFTQYSASFSRTFRKLSYKESMMDVKRRNSSFYYQSKFFREAVECFGITGKSDFLTDGRKAETGPFFSGIDTVMTIPEFSMRLRCPRSTSKHIEVSLNFATRQGIISELQNNEGASRGVPFFNV